METSFFTNYVVKRSFIFTSDELSDTFDDVHSNVKVKITNKNGQSIYGLLPKESNAVSVIKSLQNQHFVFSWETNCEKPSTPSPLKKRIGAKCYLVYFRDGNIGISTDPTYVHYLLAEMFPESDFFEITYQWKIEIV
uniref:Uncharacterized protein n=1 Tax=Panagrolaimus sp. PS1159 TaxID=55785 RepID=A0AC35FHL5_9BILA